MITLNETTQHVTFQFFRPHAASVQLVGSFNDWSSEKTPMERLKDGWWQITLDVTPGDHAFQYVVNDHDRYADFAAHGVEMNEYGGWQSLLTVPEAAEPAVRPELLRVVDRDENRLALFPSPDESVLSHEESTKKAA